MQEQRYGAARNAWVSLTVGSLSKWCLHIRAKYNVGIFDLIHENVVEKLHKAIENKFRTCVNTILVTRPRMQHLKSRPNIAEPCKIRLQWQQLPNATIHQNWRNIYGLTVVTTASVF